jgi:hypothetical protein
LVSSGVRGLSASSDSPLGYESFVGKSRSIYWGVLHGKRGLQIN